MLSIGIGSRATSERRKSRRAPGVEAIAFMAPVLWSTGAYGRSSFATMNETSQPVELLLSVTRDGPATLGAQIEDGFRRAIRDGALRPGARIPSTRDLARQLGVSRRVAVDAYAQLAAEGWLTLRQGARPRVSGAAAGPPGAPVPEPAAPEPATTAHRYDF